MGRTAMVAAIGALALCGLGCGSTAGLDTATSGSRPALGDEVASEGIDPCGLLTVSEIEDVTGWRMPEGERPTEHESDGQAVCSFSSPRDGGEVQVQLHEGAGRELFEQRRGELEAPSADGGVGEAFDVDVAGAEQAYESPEHGVVGALVGEHFVQVMVVGPADDDEHVELASLVSEELS